MALHFQDMYFWNIETTKIQMYKHKNAPSEVILPNYEKHKVHRSVIIGI